MPNLEDDIAAVASKEFFAGCPPERCAAVLEKAAQMPEASRQNVADYLEQWARTNVIFSTTLILVNTAGARGPDVMSEARNLAQMFAQIARFVADHKDGEPTQVIKFFLDATKNPPADAEALTESQLDALLAVSARMEGLYEKNRPFFDLIRAIQTKSEMFELVAGLSLKPEEERICLAEAMENIFFHIRRKICREGKAGLNDLALDPTCGYGPANAAIFAQFIAKTKGDSASLFARIYAEKTKSLPASAKFPEYSAALYAAYEEAEALQKELIAQKKRAAAQQQAAAADAVTDSHLENLKSLRPARPSLKPPAQGG